MAPRKLEDLLAQHFDRTLDNSGADELDLQVTAGSENLKRFSGLVLLEGLLLTRTVSDAARFQLTQRVMRSVTGEKSGRRFTGGVMRGLAQRQGRGKSASRNMLIAAAAALMLAAAGAWLLSRPGEAGRIRSAGNSGRPGEKLSYGQQLTTSADRQLTVKLSDGSVMTVSPGSSVSVPRSRRIRLARGGIRIQCRADRDNPFSVFARGTEARAVGTEFKVKIDEQLEHEEKPMKASRVIVSVLSGLVLVSNSWGQLEAGEGRTAVSVNGKRPGLLANKNTVSMPAEDPSAVALKKNVNFEFVQSPLSEACAFISSFTGKKVTCDKALAGRGISLRLKNVPADCGLRWLARLSKAKVYELKDKSILISRAVPENATELVYAADDDSEEWKKEIENALKKKVSFEFVQTPLSECVAFLNQFPGVNMVVDPEVTAVGKEKPVTLKMTDASVSLCLNWLLKLSGDQYRIVDHAIYITNASKPGTGENPAKDNRTGAGQEAF